ncbi:CPBP family intramembrane glutamic endopeptidase [Microlunatus sp. GCM10028923]|uniref:CPBP family intramembrane glutamic endopeptidase n=1 Tax=Microlunatus sp. GCM10028923 TaxID=3273400 RepID=UPI0036088A12
MPIPETAAEPRPAGTTPSGRFAQFGLLTLALSWLPWAALGVAGVDVGTGAGQLVFGLAASGPSLAALIMWLRFRRERRRPTTITWYGIVAGLVLGAVAPVVAALVLAGGDPTVLGWHAVTVTASVGGPLAVLAYTMVAGPLAEEFGWRGWLQPRLRRRCSRTLTAVVLGTAWAVWHLPLFLLPGTGQHQTGLVSLGAAAFFVSMIPFSYVIIYATERLRGGVWAAVAAHAGFNAAGALFPAAGDLAAMIELGVMIILAAVAHALGQASNKSS